MALTEKGYRRKTYAEILQERIDLAKELFGDDINTEENTPLGKFIRIGAYGQGTVEEEAESIYYSIFPNTASGISLDRLCAFVGITRNVPTRSEYQIKIFGTVGTEVPIGFKVGTESGINFTTVSRVTLAHIEEENDTFDGAYVDVQCTITGENGNVAANEINVITEPQAGVDSIIGIKSLISASDEESDYDLRKRFNNAKEGLGSCTEASIIAALVRIPTVTSASVAVNETNETDSAGRPPHSFECYVSGGENYHQQIAETIFEKKPIGIKTHGTVSVDVDYGATSPYTVLFSHVEAIPVFVKITIVTTSAFGGATGNDAIKQKLENYINSLGIGNPVITSSLYGKIHSVAGVKDVTLLQVTKETDASGNPINWSTANIDVSSYQNCKFQQVEINGEVV